MTKDELNRGADLAKDEEWCTDVIAHIVKNNRLILRFDTTRDCMESHEHKHCPDWLTDIILDAVEKHREEVRKEFAEL